ncbi:Flp pilus assembly protein TadB [Cupriavidus necator]|uniref:Flp pilus assembly protein TadB n=1 Tax=Cupriavidus necator (strain ATCC 17699 / DSM 428 / KCTC 22496 / NCIMB 10442 / H16 / Stanier 337) TaxID=381666 RepID=Q0KCZ4_CUPNH|nr:type II secretion system F family protein [Cupriavidus necator]KUE89637.1 secretion system protein F [Cupriavidus necator]QCC00039.1 secretion system protein F [Cupriavidus necator H16]QQB77147.1 type II secretion system F family protein [Cupriavidus necator]WKA41892.1 type II secretion system F family protein [Cupriavidus necator]CAJ92127.1 flp pilus assembly protein TadB [Cupriavidus necator H16]
MNLALVLCGAFLMTVLIAWAVLSQGKRWFVRHTQTLATEVEASLADLFIFINMRQVAGISVVAVFALPLLTWLVSQNVFFAMLSIPVSLLLPRALVKKMQRKRLMAIEDQMPDALLMMSSALRAGASFPMALESVVAESRPPISQEFDLLMREVRLGVDLMDALRNMEKRIPVPDFLMVTAAITISREVGGNLAETLESVARTLREKHQMEGKIRALTAQGKMQGLVMTGLPLFLIVVLNHMEPVAMAPLFSSPIGWGTLSVIAVMELLGYKAISKITHIDV